MLTSAGLPAEVALLTFADVRKFLISLLILKQGRSFLLSDSRIDMAKRVRPVLTRPVWPATRLTRNPIDPFKNDPFWPVTRFDPRPDWPDPNPNPTRTFCHVYQCWVDLDWGVIFIKYLLILFYLICYVLHYSLLFFTCHLYFLFLL